MQCFVCQLVNVAATGLHVIQYVGNGIPKGWHFAHLLILLLLLLLIVVRAKVLAMPVG